MPRYRDELPMQNGLPYMSTKQARQGYAAGMLPESFTTDGDVYSGKALLGGPEPKQAPREVRAPAALLASYPEPNTPRRTRQDTPLTPDGKEYGFIDYQDPGTGGTRSVRRNPTDQYQVAGIRANQANAAVRTARRDALAKLRDTNEFRFNTERLDFLRDQYGTNKTGLMQDPEYRQLARQRAEMLKPVDQRGAEVADSLRQDFANVDQGRPFDTRQRMDYAARWAPLSLEQLAAAIEQDKARTEGITQTNAQIRPNAETYRARVGADTQQVTTETGLMPGRAQSENDVRGSEAEYNRARAAAVPEESKVRLEEAQGWKQRATDLQRQVDSLRTRLAAAGADPDAEDLNRVMGQGAPAAAAPQGQNTAGPTTQPATGQPRVVGRHPTMGNIYRMADGRYVDQNGQQVGVRP